MSGRVRRVLDRVALGLLVAAVAGCVAPSPDSGAYLENADATLSSAVSEARTVAQVLHTSLGGSTTTPYANTVVTDSEKAMGGIEVSFGTVDPPDEPSDELRDQVVTMLGDTADACAAARIAVRRGDRDAMRAAATELSSLAERMERYRGRLT